MAKREKFEVVGQITVATGIVQVGDPCYQYDGGKEWEDFCDELDGQDIVNIPHSREGGNYNNFGKAVVVTSGFGDGVYDVMVKRCLKTGRIKELKVKFF